MLERYLGLGVGLGVGVGVGVGSGLGLGLGLVLGQLRGLHELDGLVPQPTEHVELRHESAAHVRRQQLDAQQALAAHLVRVRVRIGRPGRARARASALGFGLGSGLARSLPAPQALATHHD